METEVALLDDKAGKSALRAALASNLEEAGKLETLINNLFKLTRLEASELEQHFTPVSVSKITSDAMTDTTSRAKTKSIRLVNEVKDATVMGDRTSLTQLLTILLDNAIKYSPDKSEIKITSKRSGSIVVVTVHDQGIGIEPEALRHVFERFYRADAARTRSDASGFGLGLSIAKLIADVHNGSITITSKMGKGTSASLELPVADTKA
jgi:signal transduction histidine kinase